MIHLPIFREHLYARRSFQQHADEALAAAADA
jgi:hypothetical protein